MHGHEGYNGASHERSYSLAAPQFAEKDYIPRSSGLVGDALTRVEESFTFFEVIGSDVPMRDEGGPPKNYEGLTTQLDFHYNNPKHQYEGIIIIATRTYEDGTESVFVEMDHIDPNRKRDGEHLNTWLGIEFYDDGTQATRLVDKQNGERFMVTTQEETENKIQYCAFKLNEAVLHKHDFLDE